MEHVFSTKTLVPLSLVITIAPLIYWATSTANATDRNTQDIEEIRRERDGLYKEIYAIRADLAGISAKINIIRDYIVETPKREK